MPEYPARPVTGPIDGAWIDMVLTNGFTAGSPAPQYMKDSRGVVHMRGIVLNPPVTPSAGSCWTAPVGFRPLIQAGSFLYFDFSNGGSNLMNPSRLVAATSDGTLHPGRTSANAAGPVSHPCALDRVHWQA